MRLVRSFYAACALSVAWLPASQSAAQAWIGAVVGEQVAAQQRAAQEQACLRGEPPEPKAVAKITPKLDGVMASYFALSAKSNEGAIGKVFWPKADGALYRDAEGTVAPLDLGARLDEPTPILNPVGGVVAGDLQSARFIWRGTSPSGDADKIYAVDFTTKTDAFWGATTWRVWRMFVTSTEAAPSVPGAYCHFDKDQAF